LISRKDTPEIIYPFIVDSEAVALPKPSSTDIRPIGKVNLVRKVTSSSLNTTYKNQVTAVSGTYQLGTTSSGVEITTNTINAFSQVHPDYDMFFPDGTNAFNCSSRDHALNEIKNRIPILLPFLLLLYGQTSNSWYFGMESGIKNIKSQEGSQQGCNMGNFICAMAFLSFINRIAQIFSDSGVNLFYIDDGSMCASFSKMLSAIDFMIDTGPQYGYIVNIPKSKYLIGKCGSFDIAWRRKQQLVAKGFSNENIKIHPNDILMASNDEILLTGYDSDLSAIEDYGAKVLGSYIGSSNFIIKMLEIKSNSLSEQASTLASYSNKQNKYLLLKYCFVPKINHLLRTVPPAATYDLCTQFELSKKVVLSSILSEFSPDNTPDWLWTQASMSTKAGGLGLKNSKHSRHTGLTASLIETLPKINKFLPDFTSTDVDLTSDLKFATSYLF